MNHLISIVGPTGIGKSGLAIKLAMTFNCEVVNADSRQVYRHMDIGTAKPNHQQLANVPHHLINIINPNNDFSLAQFQQMACGAISDIHGRGKLPLLVGGSGQYVWSILEGWEIPHVPPDQEMRRHLEKQVATSSKDELYAELVARVPEVAQRIDRHNIRRVIRALEISQVRQGQFDNRQRSVPPYNNLIIGLTTDRTELYCLIDLRVDRMIEKGLVAEVQELVDRGYNYNLPAMSAIGYRQIGSYLKGEMGLKTAVQQMKYDIHRFVRQQYNWFKPEDSRINWFDICNNRAEAEISALVEEFISKK
jgi:tRNA dimethylallyltransferase